MLTPLQILAVQGKRQCRSKKTIWLKNDPKEFNFFGYNSQYS